LRSKVVKIRVIYADTDAMGIVYHTNYIRWFEVGRTELMRDMGIVYAQLEREGYYLPITQLTCHYLAPARYDEWIQLETRINYFRRASIKFDYEIRDEEGGKMLVEGSTVHAFINGEGKIIRAPRSIAECISG
jgi:acyl-CoA thioester hydrolase